MAETGTTEINVGGEANATDAAAAKTDAEPKDNGTIGKETTKDDEISLRPTKVPAGTWRSRQQMAKADDEASASGAKAKGSGPKLVYTRDELYAFKDKCTEKPEEDIDELMRAQSKTAAQRNVRRATDESEISLRPGGTTTFGFATKGGPRLRERPNDAAAPGARGPADRNKTPTADADFNWREGARPADKGALPGIGDDFEALKTSENAWRIIQPSSEEEKVIKKIKGILNKLTPEKFDTLTGQILNAGIESFVTLKKVIDLVFDKAVGEPAFCKVYAELCAKLAVELPEFKPEPEQQPVSFKRVLLNKCQEEFEMHKEAESKIEKLKELSKEEREVEERKIRMRMLGNIRLIGELFKQRMLTEKIMHECVMMLLGPKKEEIHEDNLEALCRLMETVGQQMDHEKARPYIDKYFARVREFSTDQQFSSRIRFMLMDLIDLRHKFKWVPRRKKETQKTIEEIHAEANLERALAGDVRGLAAAPGRPGAPGPSGIGRPGSASDLSRMAGASAGLVAGRGGGRPGTPGSAAAAAGRGAPAAGAGRASPTVAVAAAPSKPAWGGAGMPGSPKGSITEAAARLQVSGRGPSPSGAAAAAATAAAAERASPPAGAAAGGAPKGKLTEAEMLTKVKNYANEYFTSGEAGDAVLDIKELNMSAETKIAAVLELLVESFNKHDRERELTANLLAECAKQKAFAEGDFVKALKEVAGMLPDLAEDAGPKCYDWFGEFIVRLAASGAITKALLQVFLPGIVKELSDPKLEQLIAKISPSIK